MISLLNAIYAKYTGTPALVTAFPGGMHRDVAPEGTAVPYIVTNVPAGTTTSYYGGRREDCFVRISAVGVGHDATGTLAETLFAAYDDTTLTLASGQNYDARRTGPPIPVMENRTDENGNEVWRWVATYIFSTR